VHLSLSALLSPAESARLADDLAGAVRGLAASVLPDLPAGMLVSGGGGGPAPGHACACR
jgi:hypothetical protein